MSQEFQSTLPRGERRRTSAVGNCRKRFQSTLPRGERRATSFVVIRTNIISIHAPTRGATMSQEKFNAMMAISIHAPTRGATFIGFDCCFDILISIHAPTRGATLTACTKEGFARFQSTLPRGERRIITKQPSSPSRFQSTLPRGERQL